MPETMTLLEYANARPKTVVLWWTHVDPTTRLYPAGAPEWEADGLLATLYALTGEVGETGEWAWDGEDPPADDRGNSIGRVSAYVDADEWDRLTEDDA